MSRQVYIKIIGIQRHYLANLSCYSLAGLALSLSNSAIAQSGPVINANPLQSIHDVNDIDLVNGVLRKTEPLVSYGDPGNPLSISFNITSPGPQEGCCNLSTNGIGYNSVYEEEYSAYYQYVTSPTGNSKFLGNCFTPNTYWALFTPGASLTCSSTELSYSDREGNKFYMAHVSPETYKELFHNGETWKYYYGTSGLKFIVSNRGYGIQISYGATQKISFYNKSYIYCDETLLVDCTGVSSLATSATITGQTLTTAPYTATETVTRPDGTGITINLAATNGLTADVTSLPTLGVANSTRTDTNVYGDGSESQEANYSVAWVNDGQNNWHYEHSPPAPGRHDSFTETVATDPAGHQRIGTGLEFSGVMEAYSDEFFRSWGFEISTVPGGYNNPEGDGVAYVRDARGNPIETHIMAKTGSGIPDIVSTASYPATCTNFLTCNLPTWTRDAKCNQTDFTYDATHGGVLTQTGPADANGIRPQTRYTYVQRYAWILNSSGGYVHADGPIWLLDSESFCRASAATGNPSAPCIGNDEVKTSYEYGPDSGPNNLYLRGKAVTADGVTLRTCYGNDRNGRRISETSPRGTGASCP